MQSALVFNILTLLRSLRVKVLAVLVSAAYIVSAKLRTVLYHAVNDTIAEKVGENTVRHNSIPGKVDTLSHGYGDTEKRSYCSRNITKVAENFVYLLL